MLRKLVVIFALGILLAPHLVSAHNVNGQTWLAVNDESVIENPIPPTHDEHLPWSSETIDETFPANQPLTFKLTLSALQIDDSQPQIDWDFGDMKTSGNTVQRSFSTAGNKFFTITFYSKSDHIQIMKKQVMIVVGSLPTSPTLSWDGKQIGNDDTVPIDSTHPEIAITNIDGNYSYTWDLAQGKILNATKLTLQDMAPSIPTYVILRTTDKRTNVFTDLVIHLQNDNPNNVKIDSYFLPQRVADDPANFNLRDLLLVLGIPALIIGGIGLFIASRKKPGFTRLHSVTSRFRRG